MLVLVLLLQISFPISKEYMKMNFYREWWRFQTEEMCKISRNLQEFVCSLLREQTDLKHLKEVPMTTHMVGIYFYHPSELGSCIVQWYQLFCYNRQNEVCQLNSLEKYTAMTNLLESHKLSDEMCKKEWFWNPILTSSLFEVLLIFLFIFPISDCVIPYITYVFIRGNISMLQRSVSFLE